MNSDDSLEAMRRPYQVHDNLISRSLNCWPIAAYKTPVDSGMQTLILVIIDGISHISRFFRDFEDVCSISLKIELVL